MNFTVMGLWNEMGVVARAVVIVLVAMSMYSLAIAVERIVTFRRARTASSAFAKALAAILGKPGHLQEARGIEEKFPGSPVARVAGAGFAEFDKAFDSSGLPVVTYDIVDAVVRAMERIRERELANMKRGLPLLATVSSSAPFVGLFGTVGGIITAFQKLADPAKGGGGIGTVSAGIAEALVTTAVGLGVAIIAVWFYNFFNARVDELTVDMDETASELADTVIKDGRTKRAAGTP
ncbi:MAG TPA: MotA/TolQ/ExbB proton channel family protein [Polyangia bacterium]|jgi:biopolymer transport protein ExbB/TolQ